MHSYFNKQHRTAINIVMGSLLAFLIIVVVAACPRAGHADNSKPPVVDYAYRAVVAEVTDGDTLRCDIDLGFDMWRHDTSLRLLGVFAPETRTTDLAEKKKGLAVKEFVVAELARLAPDRKIIVLTHKDANDKYGRYLAEVWLGEENLNQAIRDFMTKAGIRPSGKGVKP